MTPRVSVVVPCYDHGRYLDEAVASVFAQTFQDFEIVIVDDGSTDPATRALLDGWDRPRTRVLRIPNRGLSGARNAGIRATAGELVCCLDADDVLEPTLFEKSVALLDARPDVAFVSHWLRTFGDETWDWTPASCDFPALLDANTVNGAALVRRRALEAAGLFDETMRDGCEDWDLWITMVERGEKGAILPEFLFRYRRRADSMSRAMAFGGAGIALYERLARKHEASFRAHLPHLYARRARVAEGLAADVRERRHEDERWLGPERRKKREHAAALRDKLARARARAEMAAKAAKAALVDDLAVRVSAAEDLAAGREREIVRLGGRVGELALKNAVLAGEVAAAEEARRGESAILRSSWSWKITAPLRALHALLTGGKP